MLKSATQRQLNRKTMDGVQEKNNMVKADVLQIVESEMERIKNDPDLQHLIQQE